MNVSDQNLLIFDAAIRLLSVLDFNEVTFFRVFIQVAVDGHDNFPFYIDFRRNYNINHFDLSVYSRVLSSGKNKPLNF